jgi:outer membrane receptor protein involved in Fe transport
LSIAGTFLLCASITFAQETSPTPSPDRSGVTIEEVIVTGSNIPTSEEVGPNPVDTYRREDIIRLGVRSTTDLIQKLPAATGAAINENVVNGGDGRVEINLRGILAKETLVLQDGRRLAPVGFAGDTVDLNTIPLGLIDHIDILKDGASAIYGADAVAGVFNVWLIHKFRGLELYASYGNTNLGSANDMGEERGYLLAGIGDDKTDIVVYAESYNRAAIFSRDADISSDADFTRFGGSFTGGGAFAGHVGPAFVHGQPASFVYQPNLNGGALTPTPHAFPNVASDPQYVRFSPLLRKQRFFNFAALTPAVPAVDREYLYGSLDRKICDQYLELFADFKYARTSGMAPWRKFNLLLMYGRMRRTPSGSLCRLASAYRFRTHSIHSPSRITPRLGDLIRGSRKLNQLRHLPALSSPPSLDTVGWKPDRAPSRSRRTITSLPAASKVI